MIQVASQESDWAAAVLAAAAEVEVVAGAVSGRVLVFDRGAFEASRGAMRIAVFPRFALDWDPQGADAVLVAHDVVKAALPKVLRVRATVVGALAPPGITSADSSSDTPTVIVAPSLLTSLGLTTLLFQLELTSNARFLFDVGDDPEVASALRAALAGHDLEAGLFASSSSEEAWRVADLALGAEYANHALAAGTGLVLFDDGSLAARALVASGVALVAKSATLAVTLDEAGTRARDLRQAALGQDAAGTAERILEVARQLERASIRPGLPSGIEWLTRGSAKEAEPTPADALRDGDGDSPEDPSSDDAIERELAELKRRLE